MAESKIVHKSPVLHPLVRFVNEETAALLFNLKPEQIYRIDCWRHVVYVHGKGVSKFVSYADFPPSLGVVPPTERDFFRWRKRWKNKWNSRQAPEFWQQFYAYQFQQATSVPKLFQWGKLVNLVKAALSEAALQWLRDVYSQEKYVWDNFC
ncbi:MAG: hypothetical protein KME08_12710 [Aphanothece sp. CMT-3BRIN-NPC111]|nr:hypothetical protein [Aphanothece sp. CMT-3BRIN-NPC111]